MRLPNDPRWLQLAFLATFLAFGLGAREFPAWHAPLLFATALGLQALLDRRGLLSAAITAFGLTLLLRTDAPAIAVLAAVLAIGSKFAVRVRGRHVFNPANAGLCACMLLTPHAWASPAQWGEATLLLLWMSALGLLVAHRALRSDVSLAFLAAFTLLRLWRVLELRQPLEVLGHQLASGSLLLFTFFMISDPKTTPRARWARVVLGVWLAVLGHVLQFRFYVRNPLLWALFVSVPLTPLFDFLDQKEPSCTVSLQSSLS